MILTIVIFAATYLVVAVGHLPGFRLDRAGAALIGAALMIATGALSADEAFRAVNLDTLALLLGMMIVVANLRLAGFFALCHGWIIGRAHRPVILLTGIVGVTGLLSAVLVNDTVCLMLTPLVAETVRDLKRNPIPYLLALAMASNAGGVATITGNPQNMMIGTLSGIAYRDFAVHLAPIAAMSLIVIVLVVMLAWRREFLRQPNLAAVPIHFSVNTWLLGKSLVVTAGVILACFLGVRPALAAMLGGALLFVTRRLKPARIYRDIDWSLLLLFAGLFIVVAAMQKAVVTPDLLARVRELPLNQTPVLALLTAVLSNLVSNVPAVLVLEPFVASLADPKHAWLTVAMAATLAGNFTILGSIANLIVVQGAARRGIRIGFWTYFAVGAPVTIVTLILGVLWLR